MATPKGLTRKITRRQALSYQRLTPNAIGVTAISSVNGRGARARAIRETRSARGAYGTNKKRRTVKQAAALRKLQAGAARYRKTQASKRRRRYGRNQPMAREPFRMVVGVEKQPRVYRRPTSTVHRVAERVSAGYGRALKPLRKVERAGERVIDAARGGYARAYRKTRQLLGGRAVRRTRVVGVPVIGIGAETVHTVRRRRPRRATTTERTMRRGKRRTAAQRRAFKKMQAGLRRWKASHGKRPARRRHRRATAAQLRSLRKARRAAKAWRLSRGYKGNKGKARKSRKARRSSARRGYRPVAVKIGRKSARTYLFRTRKGGVKHIPLWAETGARSASEFAAATRAVPPLTPRFASIRRRVAAVMRARNRSAARVQRAGDIFTPNRGRRIPFSTWSESMHRNKKRKTAKRRSRKAGKRLTKHQIRVRAGRKAARTRKAKKAARLAARRKGGRKARRSSRRKSSRRMHRNRRRHVRRFEENRRRRRRATPNRRRRARRHFEENRRRRRARPNRRRRYDENRRRHRRVHRNRRRYLPIRVSRAMPMHFEENRRRSRRRHRSYRSNFGGAFWKRFVGMLKIGLLAGAGFMGHRALTKIVSSQLLSKVPQLTTGPLAPYKDIISGVLVAGAGMLAVDKFAKKQAAEVNAGIFVSLVQSMVTTALTQMGQPGYAAALSGYPDAEGRAYRGFGEYVPVSGFGDLPARSRYGGRMLAQAAAGFGVPPMLTQAAAGFGAAPQLTQAAAGVGEYIAQNLEGVGDYEMVNGVGSPELTSEGIRPDLASAEQALDIAEAAAGLGDIGTRSQLNPAMVTQPVSHQPGGMRSAIFSGGDGIFSK